MAKQFSIKTWIDEVLAGSPTYNISGIGAGQSITLDQTVTQAGDTIDATELQRLEDMLDLVDDYLYEAETEITVSSGTLTVTKTRNKVQPETGTADVITNLAGAVANTFGILYISDDGTDSFTIEHGTGNISCAGETDIAWSGGAIMYFYNGTTYFIIGGGGGSGGGLTYNAATVTTGNVTAVSGNFYDCTIAGMTADRDFNLPTPAAVGERIGVRVLDGDDTYELIIKANSVEITRLYMAGEYMEFESYGTGAGDWKRTVDGRIPATCRIEETSAATAVATATNVQIQLDATNFDNGSHADLPNYQINIRRAGKYLVCATVQLSSMPAASARNEVYIIAGGFTTRIRSGAGNGHYWGMTKDDEFNLSAGNTVALWTRQESGSSVNTFILYNANSALQITEILE